MIRDTQVQVIFKVSIHDSYNFPDQSIMSPRTAAQLYPSVMVVESR